ncbi:phage/plasmid replication protein [Paenibacillus marchantiae]|uniref:phage/plasmid replication domain-containing protein n=1 Tax=Paenibacillus marchantiae TaxID=3026433 RepID=UPI00237A29AD|nr:phage/plasmid replication protein [Paenibacillus marchantiae]WDQ33869.1 phage/plasmid replication protein [Paenibacillus marchantiae]
MIHTARLFVQLSDEEVVGVKRRFKEDIALVHEIIDGQFEEVFDTDITIKFGTWYLFTTIDVVQLLRRGIVLENDLSTIQKALDAYLYFVLGENDKEFTLCRIDYRFDAVIADAAERQVVLDLLKKSIDRFGYKVKRNIYGTTLYYNSKSIVICVYDKEAERQDKCKVIKKYEKDVLRVEVRLLNRHLNYMKRHYRLDKKMGNYFNHDFWIKYMANNIMPIFHSGNFYTKAEAFKIIKRSGLKEQEKTKVRKFLTDVMKLGFDGIKSLKRKKPGCKLKPAYSSYVIKENIKRLEALGINPLLVEKNDEVILSRDMCIRNPFYFG